MQEPQTPQTSDAPQFSVPQTASDPAHSNQIVFDAAHVLESVSDAFFALDADWRFTYINDQSEWVMVRTHGELTGKRFWDEFPAAVGSLFEQYHHKRHLCVFIKTSPLEERSVVLEAAAQHLVRRSIAKADEAAQGGVMTFAFYVMRDDVCFLVAAMEQAASPP